KLPRPVRPVSPRIKAMPHTRPVAADVNCNVSPRCDWEYVRSSYSMRSRSLLQLRPEEVRSQSRDSPQRSSWKRLACRSLVISVEPAPSGPQPTSQSAQLLPPSNQGPRFRPSRGPPQVEGGSSTISLG